jgi:hypothetical protein
MYIAVKNHFANSQSQTLKVEMINDGNTTKPKPPMSTVEILKSPGIPITLAIFSYCSLLGFAYTAGQSTLDAYLALCN